LINDEGTRNPQALAVTSSSGRSPPRGRAAPLANGFLGGHRASPRCRRSTDADAFSRQFEGYYSDRNPGETVCPRRGIYRRRGHVTAKRSTILLSIASNQPAPTLQWRVSEGGMLPQGRRRRLDQVGPSRVQRSREQLQPKPQQCFYDSLLADCACSLLPKDKTATVGSPRKLVGNIRAPTALPQTRLFAPPAHPAGNRHLADLFVFAGYPKSGDYLSSLRNTYYSSATQSAISHFSISP
jgi:hypothetical protein